MANTNFIVQNGLTVGPLTIDAATGSITTTGNLSVAGLTANITQDAITAGTVTSNVLSVSGNITTGNLTTTGNITTGNITVNSTFSASLNNFSSGLKGQILAQQIIFGI